MTHALSRGTVNPRSVVSLVTVWANEMGRVTPSRVASHRHASVWESNREVKQKSLALISIFLQ